MDSILLIIGVGCVVAAVVLMLLVAWLAGKKERAATRRGDRAAIKRDDVE